MNKGEWKHDWASQARGETVISTSAKYKGVQINSIERSPYNTLSPITQSYEVAIYGEEHRKFPEYRAKILETSLPFSVGDKYFSYVRFEKDTPIETVVKFIEDFQNGKIDGLLTREEADKIVNANNTAEQTTETSMQEELPIRVQKMKKQLPSYFEYDKKVAGDARKQVYELSAGEFIKARRYREFLRRNSNYIIDTVNNDYLLRRRYQESKGERPDDNKSENPIELLKYAKEINWRNSDWDGAAELYEEIKATDAFLENYYLSYETQIEMAIEDGKNVSQKAIK